MPGVPELYSVTAPFGISAALLDPQLEDRWRIRWPGKKPIYLEKPLPIIGISSDGLKIAYVDAQGQAFINDSKQTTPINAPAKVLGVIWGQTAWRVGYGTK